MKRYEKWCLSSSKLSAVFSKCSQTRGFYGEPPTGAEVGSGSNCFPTRATHRIQFHQRDEQIKCILFPENKAFIDDFQAMRLITKKACFRAIAAEAMRLPKSVA